MTRWWRRSLSQDRKSDAETDSFAGSIASDDDRVASQSVLETGPDAVRQGRHFVTEHLTDFSPSTVADAELVASELFANAVLHGAPPVVVTVVTEPANIRVEVKDTSPRMPVRALPSEEN